MPVRHGRKASANLGILYAKVAKRSGKERATGVPSYALRQNVRPGESPEVAIKRITGSRYPALNDKTGRGANTESSKTKKGLTRG